MHPSVKAVVDDYWAARYGKATLQPKLSSSRENFVVRNVPPRQQSSDSVQAEPARAIDPARQRRPPDPPSRPSVSSLPPQLDPIPVDPRSSLDIAEAEIRRAESRALDEKARLRSQGVHHPKPRTMSNAERDEHLRRELRQVEEEAWERHLEELRWQEKKSIEERKNFEEAYCRKSLGEISAMSHRQSSSDTPPMRQTSYPDAALSPMVSRQSYDRGVPAWQESVPPRNVPSRESYDSRVSHRRQDSLAPAAEEMRPTTSRQSTQTHASHNENQRPLDHRLRQVSLDYPAAPSSSHGSQASASRAGGDTSKVTLACLLLAHLLHNTGDDTPAGSSCDTPPSRGPTAQAELNAPTNRASFDSYRQLSCDDPAEAIDLEDGPFRASPVQRHGSVRLNRPGGPRDPRDLHRPLAHRSSFSSSIAPSDSISVVSGVDREHLRRAATPPSPVIDDPPESQLPAQSPSISMAHYAFESRSSLRTAPPGYLPDHEVPHHHPPTPPILPASPPPQYSPSSSGSVSRLDPLRARKPATMYHNRHTVPGVPRPNDQTTEDCNVQ